MRPRRKTTCLSCFCLFFIPAANVGVGVALYMAATTPWHGVEDLHSFFTLFPADDKPSEQVWARTLLMVKYSGIFAICEGVLGFFGLICASRCITLHYGFSSLALAAAFIALGCSAFFFLESEVPKIVVATNQLCRGKDQFKQAVLMCDSSRRLAAGALQAMAEQAERQKKLVDNVAAARGITFKEEKCKLVDEICSLPDNVFGRQMAAGLLPCGCAGVPLPFGMAQMDKNKLCPMYDNTPAQDSCGMYCNNWNEGPGGSMWCFVHIGNECKTHRPNVEGLYPEFEASFEACTTPVMLANARSAPTSRGVDRLYEIIYVMGGFAVIELIVVVGSSTYLLSESAASGARCCNNTEIEEDDLLEPVVVKKSSPAKRGVFKPMSVQSAPPPPIDDTDEEFAPEPDVEEYSAEITSSSGGGSWKPIYRPVTRPAQGMPGQGMPGQGMSWQDQMYNSVANPLGSAVPLNPMNEGMPAYTPLSPGQGSFATGYPQYPYMR